ncbi:DUF4339 domain-containing protein [Mesorhizobium sp. M0715]|uniref:DUF4339 domain-containing protein n=1 Tax=Mesorhizobium sp. M0715 TaxID=2956990 RepID=UPI00333781DB
MTDWYYDENGAQRGPVSEGDLNTMLVNRLLSPHTLVWTATLGSGWKPASQTHLEAAPQAVKPPPLPSAKNVPPPLPATINPSLPHQLAGVAASTGEPPSDFHPERVPAHDHYAKWMAFWPLLLMVVDMVLAADGNNIEYGPYSRVAPFLAVWGSLIFAVLDARNVYNSWRNPKRMALVPFILLSPLVYFWRRAWLLKTGYAYMGIWAGCALVYAIAFAVMAQS